MVPEPEPRPTRDARQRPPSRSDTAAGERAECYARFRAALPDDGLPRVVRSAMRLHAALEDAGGLTDSAVMVAYGGGKDSTYAVAFVRGMQLVLDRLYGTTFRLRVVTSRHAGMPPAVMENIGRAYRALGLIDDPDCELLVVDGEEVSPFSVDLPLPDRVVERGRTDILMAGHRAAGDGRPTFCNVCNLNMVRAFAVAAGHGAGVDFMVTGDSPVEQNAYYLWTSRMAHRLKVTPAGRGQQPLGRFLSMFDGISQAYFADIHGAGSGDAAPWAATRPPTDRLRFFSIYEETDYESDAHWGFLTDFLGFVFDDIAFSFSESDCGNPALMAHLRGLKVEHRYGRSYAEGVAEYVDFAIGLMVDKQFPEHLVATIRDRYAGPEGVQRMRTAMREYALEAHRLTEEQLVCMVFAPFVDHGAGLADYLSAAHPELRGRTGDIHELLAGEPDAAAGDQEPVRSLERWSGLALGQLRTLYRTTALHRSSSSLPAVILAGDPHKKVIRTRVSADGPETEEIISGR